MRAFAGALLLSLVTVGCNRNPSTSKLDPDIARFIAAKRLQVQQMPAALTNGLPNTVWRIFDAAGQNNFSRVTNLFSTLQQEAGRFATPTATPGPMSRVWLQSLQFLGLRPKYWPGLDTEAWTPIHEVKCIGDVYQEWDHKWMRRFGRDIIDSIPSGSIYFGGTDGGRFIITALSESHAKGQPFFTVTQNQLAVGTYLNYLRFMYGTRIQTPTGDNSQQAFIDYLQEAKRRKEANKLKPGEDVQIVQGRVQVSGQVAIMEINALLVWNIFTNNPDREFFIEESTPLDWMYPYLAPHGLILKVNREPLAELSDETVKRDHEYWTRYTKELIGDWLTPETSIETVCAFSKKAYLRKDLSGFTGDENYVRNDATRAAFAKLRAAIGGVYAWRAMQAKSDDRNSRMNREADFALKQAFALCPMSETAGRYINLLLTQGRTKEALQVAQTLQECVPENHYGEGLLKALRENLTTNQPSSK